jgi:hypothetical protein
MATSDVVDSAFHIPETSGLNSGLDWLCRLGMFMVFVSLSKRKSESNKSVPFPTLPSESQLSFYSFNALGM